MVLSRFPESLGAHHGLSLRSREEPSELQVCVPPWVGACFVLLSFLLRVMNFMSRVPREASFLSYDVRAYLSRLTLKVQVLTFSGGCRKQRGTASAESLRRLTRQEKLWESLQTSWPGPLLNQSSYIKQEGTEGSVPLRRALWCLWPAGEAGTWGKALVLRLLLTDHLKSAISILTFPPSVLPLTKPGSLHLCISSYWSCEGQRGRLKRLGSGS